MSEQAILISAAMYDCRRAAQTLLGERFKAKMADYGALILAVAARDQVNEIEALMRIARAVKPDGITTLYLTAASVELIEPS